MRQYFMPLVLAVVACGPPHDKPDAPPLDDRPADTVNPNPTYVEVGLIPAVPNPDLDVLFMIDDSPSMLDKQNNLKAAFPALVNELSALPGGLPSLHIGVVTSDLGASGSLDAQPGPTIGSGPGSCGGVGKNGILTTNNSAAITGNFISDLKLADGSRMKNYTGTLADAFSAAASVGAAGCGFEQSIEATKKALANTVENAGFLRPSATLAIVYLTDEDDCSMAHSALMSTDTTTLGPLNSFRCTRFGITCDQGGTTTDEMNQPGTKTGCHSNESSTYLTTIAGYASFFRGLKPDSRNVMVAALAAPATPFAVELRAPPGGGTSIPALAHSCTYTDTQGSLEVGDNGVRIAQLATGFARHSVSDICAAADSAVRDIGAQIGALAGSPCLTSPIAMPAQCQVLDQRPGAADIELPACDATHTTDCYTITADAQVCATAQHLKLTVTRSGTPAADLMTSVRCAQ